MKRIFYILLCALLLVPIISLSTRVLADSPNLIANPSVEIATNNQPLNWNTNSWGANNPAFSYDSTGNIGTHSLSVSVTNYVSGDAKWVADQANVTAGQTYTYSEYSKSTVATELDAAYLNAAGVTSYAYLQTVPSSTNWQLATTTVTIPTGVVSVSIYHIIYSNGSLQSDDFSLTATPTPTPAPAPATNLIANNSFETANGTDPASWAHGGWGTNTPTYTYLSAGAHTGVRSVGVSLSSFVNGDAKWYSTPVIVTPGAYTYQDYYTSGIPTRVVVVMTNTSGVDSYTELPAVPSASVWTLYSAGFTAPTGISSITIYHLLNMVGTLTIDDVSLVSGTAPAPLPPPTPTSSDLIPNPSFETANGAKPASWTGDSWGINTPTFTYVNNDGHTGTNSAKVAIANYSSGDAKWSFTPITTLTPGRQYHLSAWYKTNAQPRVVASYVDTQGVSQYITLPNALPGASATTVWQQYSATLNVPANAVSMTVFFLLSSNGWLQTDDFSLIASAPVGFNAPLISLTFDDGWSSIYTNGLPILKKYGFASTQYLISGKLNTSGYMTNAMARAFLSSGSEIGSHTVTHPDLTKLTTTQITSELTKSQNTLRTLFGPNVANAFASPYGTYNTNSMSLIKQYYQSHRSTDVGYNTKDTFNPYNILVQNVNTNTTPTEVANWVAKTKADKSWLVLVYHTVIPSPTIDDYGVTPANLDTELSNIKSSGIAVQTLSQALATIKSQP